MSIGERIINEIIKQGMVNITAPDPAVGHVITWNANACEQLTALVAEETQKLRRALEEIRNLGPDTCPTFEEQVIRTNQICTAHLNPWT